MLKNSGKLAGKTLFVTGASRGIGKTIALKAAKDGANVVIAAKTGEPHPKLPGTIYTAATEIESAGGKALPIVVDVRDEKAVKTAVDSAVETFGGIDILINNASAISLTGTLHTPMKTFDLMHQINSRGTYMVSKYCLPHLINGKNPHILNLSPPLNLNPIWFKGHVGYTMAKYGMSMCVLGMAEEFKGNGVACNAIWPRTAIMTAAMEMLGGDGVESQCRKPEIVADAAYAMLCRDSKKYTGNFAIDDEVLKEEGITNLDIYACDPKGRLMPDFFLDAFADQSAAGCGSSSGGSTNVGAVFDQMKSIINEDMVSKVKAIFAFEVTGDSPSTWFVDLKNGSGSCGSGAPSIPADATFKMKSDIFIQMFEGKVNPTTAFMGGQLEISGDLSKAMSLEKFMKKMHAK